MPWKLLSHDPHERQTAVLNLTLWWAHWTGRDVYVGVCGCPQSIQTALLIAAPQAWAQCIFCSKHVRLTRIPKCEIVTEGNQCKIVMKSAVESGAGTASITNQHLNA